MGKRGRKDCINCNTEIGARSHLCSHCGYHFPTKEVRKDLLRILLKKEENSGPTYYTSLGRGRKQCPSCKVIVGGVTKECPKCNFDFSSAKKEKDEIKEEKKKIKAAKREEKDEGYVIRTPMRLRFNIPELDSYPDLTPKEHAKRVLSYGKDRATNLLHLAKNSRCWKHVDWDIVEEGLV